MKELFRAVVMLLVLVGLPAAWIYYGPLPPSAQKVVDRVVDVVKDATGWQQPHCDTFEDKTAPRFATSTPAAPSLPPEPPAVIPVSLSNDAPAASNLQQQLAPLLEKLQAFGPTDYSLEEWGAEGEFFRFRCAMPIGGQAGFSRQFEAVAANPAECIQQVIGEIGQWRGKRQAGSQGYSAIASNSVLSR